MPGQLLTLRLLNSSASATGFSHMKLTTRFNSSRNFHGISIFSKALPFKLKCFGLSARPLGSYLCKNDAGTRVTAAGFRRYSSRPLRSNGRNQEFSRGRAPEFRAQREIQPGRFGGGGGQNKSLVEDEAELSDWISDLKTDSFRVGLSSSDSDGDSFSSSRNRRGGRGGMSSKRLSDSESDDSGVRSRRNSRGSIRGSFSRNRFGNDLEEKSSARRQTAGVSRLGSVSKGRFDSDSNDDFDGDSFSSSRNRRGGRGGMSLKGLSDGESYDSGVGSRRNSRGSIRGSFSRNRFGNDLEEKSSAGRQTDRVSRLGSVSKSRFDSNSNDVLAPRQGRGQGSRGGFSPVKKYVRESSLSSGKGREGGDFLRRETGSGRQALKILEDEDEDEDDDDDEDSISGFDDDLLSGEESGDGDENDDAFMDRKSLLESTKVDDAPPRSSPGKSDSYLSETRFDQCSISPLSLKGIKAAGYERMTVVQEATLPVILKGKDVLAKAKTGTGKTVAFLLPAIEVIAKLPPIDRDQKRPPIYVLVICPTRELASQAATEANTLLKYHPSIGVQVVIGGTRLTLEQKRMQANPCQILVATPGRLRDHTENTPGFATRLMGVKVLVLDEADHLLDMGFRRDIEKIVAAVPKQRQTLLFSATVPEEVRQICHIALKRDHEFINTVEEGSEETHSQVRQTHLVAPLDKHFSLLYSILNEHISEDIDYKVLVFCTTAMVTRLVANLLSELNLNVREIHSRKPQTYRTRVSDEFRKSKGLILVTSDVSARGVDYPDVTLVIQVGLPADREQYIHRLGRTGRKGKEGKGILLLAPWEESFLSSVKDLPITKAPLPPIDPDTKKKVERALSHVEMKNKEAAYQAWLGYYNSNKNVGRDKCRLVELANEFSRTMGLDNPPAIPKLVLGKMGLKNVPGLRAK